MQIKSLRLNNFLGFYGDNFIDFNVSENAPVIIFVGKNGSGKTSINHAARWCLYGETKVKNVVINELELINRKHFSENSGKNLLMSVDFEWEQDGDIYHLNRRWEHSSDLSRTKNSELKLRINNSNPESESAAKEYIQRFIAKEISHFFFFDGEIQEEFDEMMGNSQTASFIRAQIERTLSIPVINEAIDWLQSRERQESQASVRASRDNEKIREKSLEIEKRESELAIHEDELAKVKSEHTRAILKLDDIEKELGNISAISDKHNEMNQEKGKISALNDQRKEKLDEIRDSLARDFWLPDAANLEKIFQDSQRKLQEFEESTKVNSSIESKIKLLNDLKISDICPLCNKPNQSNENEIDVEIAKLAQQLKEVPENELEIARKQYDLLLKMGYSNSKVIRVKNLIREYDELGGKLSIAERRYKELNLDMALHGDMNVTTALEKVKTYSRDRDNAKSNISHHENMIREGKIAIDRLRVEINRIGKITPEQQNAFNAYRYLRSLFEQVKDRYAQLVRSQVESYASEAFLEMISQKKFKGLRINENFGVNIALEGGEIEPVASAGQRKVSSVSLVAGLIKTASPKSFIFMDTPTVSFDDDHTKSLYRWAGRSGLQVCLFLHTKEFNEKDDLGEFDGRVGKIYKVEMLNEISRIK